MLNRFFTTPILAIAVDNMPKFYQETIDSISNLFPDVKQSEILAGAERLNQFLLSDVNDKENRLFIPITDKLLPIHYASGSASSGKNVTYIEEKPNLTNGANTVTLRFEVKSSLSRLSLISDIFYALTNRVAATTTTDARISFFGGSICIYNGYLKGVNRSTVTNTDREVIALTIEIAGDNTEADEIDEVESEPSTALKNETGAGENAISIITNPGGADLGIFATTAIQLPAEDIPDGFDWYEAITLEQLENSNLAEIYSTRNILRRSYRVFNVESIDTVGTRNMTTVEYNSEFLSLESDESIVQVGDYYLIRFDDRILLGLPDDN